MLGFPVEAFGLSWWFDTSRIDEDIAERLRELWSRTAPHGIHLSAHDSPADTGEAAHNGLPPGGVPPAEDERLPFILASVPLPDPVPPDIAVVPDDPDAIPYAVSRAFTLAGVRHRTGEALMLHAVGVTGQTGKLVALVGKSGTGKTTAATHLGRRLGYVTDETVVIDADLRVRPYAKPLSIIADPKESYAKIEHSPDELDLLLPPEQVTLGAVVVLVRKPEETDPRLEAIGVIEAALAVLPETSALPTLEHPLRRLAVALTGHGGPYQLTYAEIDECLEVIAQLAEPNPARDGQAPAWSHIPGAPDVSDVAPLQPGDDASTEGDNAPVLTWSTRVQRAPFSDAIASGGEVLLLRGNRPIALGGLSAHLWLSAGDQVSLGELHDRTVENIGSHPHSEQLVIEAAQALARESLLEIEETPADPPDLLDPDPRVVVPEA